MLPKQHIERGVALADTCRRRPYGCEEGCLHTVEFAQRSGGLWRGTGWQGNHRENTGIRTGSNYPRHHYARARWIQRTREIRKFMPDVPILILSMHRGKRAIQEAKLLGAQGFVSKSHLAETLLHAVDAIVRKQTFFEGDEV